MPDQSQEERVALMQKRLDSAVAACKAAPPAERYQTLGDLMKPVAMTVRLDPERYERLSEYAGGFVPRKSFQAIIVAALDAYLDE